MRFFVVDISTGEITIFSMAMYSTILLLEMEVF